MDDREFRERIDRHMARGDELLGEIREEVALTREEVRLSREQRERSDAMMERQGQALQRHAEAADRHAEAAERHATTHADLREFMREMMLRLERFGREQTAALQSLGAEMRGVGTDMRDLREESRAQTQALLKVLDRLDSGGAAGAA